MADDDDKKDADDMLMETEQRPFQWSELPREARILVYEHLREVIAKERGGVSRAALTALVSRKGARTGEMSAAEAAARGIAIAFETALDELENLDEELCPDCGAYHDDEHHVHPKDLS